MAPTHDSGDAGPVVKAKPKWRTVSLPRGLTGDILALLKERAYWPSISSFVREAAVEKLRREYARGGKVVSEPIVAFGSFV